MPMISVLGAVTAVAAALLAAPAGAAKEPGIVVLNINGSGCREKPAAVALSPDRTAITVTYSQYLVSPGSTTKYCSINLKVNPPTGYAPRITSVDYRGFASLESGSEVNLKAAYGFHGATHQESAGLHLAGPFVDDWQITDAPEGGLVIGDCKGSNVLDIDSTLTLAKTAGATTDQATMDSLDGVVPNTFHVTWQRCS